MGFQSCMAKVALLVLIASASSMSRSESDATFIPYVEAGIADYSLSFKGSVPQPGGGLANVNNKFYFDLMTIKLGLAASYSDFSANFYYLTSNQDSDTQDFPGTPLIVKWDGEREAYSGSIGYQVMDNLSVFGGYRDSQTEGSGTSNSDYTFKHDGFFAGASYRVDVTDSGGLNFALGYAWLDVDLDESLFGSQLPSADGDGSGLKLGLTWRDFLNEHIGYTIGVEYFQYDYDLSLDGVSSDDIDMEEEESTLSIGLFYVF